jgi:hypothetical protein
MRAWTEFIAIVGGPGQFFSLEQDDGSFPLDLSFVAEYGSGDFAGSLRFRNLDTDLCIQAVLPFIDDFDQPEPPVSVACNDAEPLQASYECVVQFDTY